MKWKDVAILCRTKSDFDRIEPALAYANIPYQVVGGMSFFDRCEVKDIMALLSWIINPSSQHNLSRFCKNMIEGLGESAFDKVYATLIENNIPITIHNIYTAVNNSTTKKGVLLTKFIESINKVPDDNTSVSEKLELLDKALNLKDILAKQDLKTIDSSNTMHSKVRSLGQIKVLAKGFNGSLKEFVDNISLLGAADEATNENKVTVSTIHAAKG